MVYVTRMSDWGKLADPLAAVWRAKTRGEVKAAGAWLDGAGFDERPALLAEAQRRGVELPHNAAELPGKRLVRACLQRADDAQIVTTPTARDEAFDCARCGAAVPLGGKRPRDHCPRCLHSLHVDVVPGDRAANCGGLLVPVAVESSPKGWMLRYRCARCGAERRNRVLDDLDPPDDPAAVRAVVARASAPE